MRESTETVKEWFDKGNRLQTMTHLLVVCDTFNYEQYPVYAGGAEDLKAKRAQYSLSDGNMQRVEEIYILSKDFAAQAVAQGRLHEISAMRLRASGRVERGIRDNPPKELKALEALKKACTDQGIDIALLRFEQRREFVPYPGGGFYNYETRVSYNAHTWVLDTSLIEKHPHVGAVDVMRSLNEVMLREPTEVKQSET
jgi:hypothetical protein